MAGSISKGYTFGATETVTNVKLHNLVDNATLSGITNSDIDAAAAIEESKISFDGSTAVIDTGAQTIAGIKSFTSFPVTPSSAPTQNYQVANKKYTDDECDNRCPVGSMFIWFTGTAPTDFLLCDGAAYSRATYADLYGVIANTAFRYGSLSTRTDDDTGVVTFNGGASGVTDSETLNVYWSGGSRTGMTITLVSGGAISLDGGSGDNFPVEDTAVWCSLASNKFFVPDLRGRFPLGMDSLGGTSADRITSSAADTIGMAEGNEVILEAQIPSHNHGITNTTSGAEGGQKLYVDVDDGDDYDLGEEVVSTGNTSGTGFNIFTGEAGSDNAYYQPFLTVGFIIRT